MADLAGDTFCSLHADRPSVARCPECQLYFCQECITEHEGRLTCARCLAETLSEEASSSEVAPAMRIFSIAQVVLAVLVAWAIYYLLARTIGDVPDSFHDGTIWE
ncbi:MAG: rhomboid family protein [Verrucomicrobiota bacterium]